MRVTEDTVDPIFNRPFVEVDEWRTEPVPHRYVRGGFEGTDARFSFYFPPKAAYEGRFHHNTYPLATQSDVGPFPIAFEVATGDLGFTLASGAYYVQTNNGAAFSRTAGDPTIAAYRVNAAAAKYSRLLAAEMYGPHRAYGYLYGGSGGAYQTIAGAEHTEGVWDGFMPYVLGCNNAVPSFWTARMHALRVVGRRKLATVMDALDAGGSGDPYAGLDAEERAALREATLMGFPPRGWYAHETLGSGYFADIQGAIPPLDPSYVQDFWTKPGYLGADPAASIHADRFEFETTVAAVREGPVRAFELAALPDRPVVDAHLVLTSGPAAGQSAPIASAHGRTVVPANTSAPALAAAIQAGDRVRIDNAWALALQTYHRHQMPPSPEEYAWDQFRDATGAPLYPQRPLRVGHVFAIGSIGSLLSGDIRGRMLLVQALMDIDAVPWCADWYRGQVAKALGAGFEERFALWFVDRTQHDDPQDATARAHVVSLRGALQQGLRDLARWVETGERPADTPYRVEESQVLVPASAGARGGVQPVIALTANGGARTEVSVGEAVELAALIEAPPGAGPVIAAEWDFTGAGDFPAAAEIPAPAPTVAVTATHAYDRPGTYFVVLRATVQRDGDAATPYARVQNLARARVVVR